MSGLNQSARVMAFVQSEPTMHEQLLQSAGNNGYARRALQFALDDLRDGDTPNAITMIERAIERLGRDA